MPFPRINTTQRNDTATMDTQPTNLPELTLADNTLCDCPRCRGPRERARVRALARTLITATERKEWRKLTAIDPHFQLLYQLLHAPSPCALLQPTRRWNACIFTAFAYLVRDASFRDTSSVNALLQRVIRRIKRASTIASLTERANAPARSIVFARHPR